MILIVGLAAVFTALPAQAIGVVLPAEYRVGADALGVLAMAIAAFGLMVVSNTILNGAGLPWRAMAVVVTALVAVVVSVSGMLFISKPDTDSLTSAATGSAVGMTFGLVLSAVVVRRSLGAFCPFGSVIRVLIAATLAVTVGRLLPDLDWTYLPLMKFWYCLDTSTPWLSSRLGQNPSIYPTQVNPNSDQTPRKPGPAPVPQTRRE